ncbi:MAG: polynucleotide kinase-phosphatase [Ruminococcus flavefaciens]|nr:polynucleotide kinase-phosphatase [Ruminococcus flavefaciens]
MRIEIPEFALVAMVGASSSGKTTFANTKFKPTEVLSSDFFRAMVSDDENNQKVSGEAFDVLFYVAGKRLDLMKLTVIDATNLQQSARKQILGLAREKNVHSVAIVLNIPEQTLLERNNARENRQFPERVIRNHCNELRRCIKKLKREGFRFVYVLNSQEEIDNAEIVRTKLWNDKKDEHGPFDIIGDIHGCYGELKELLSKLGYVENENGIPVHPDGRKAVFLGDFCDRGYNNAGVLKLVMSMIKNGNALSVVGNHEVKLLKYLNGKNVNLTHGLDRTVEEIEKEPPEFKAELKNFIDGLISHYVLDDGKLAVSHAGIKEEYMGRGSGRVREFCIYGDTTGETDELGLPVRLNWSADYRGRATVVYGHTPCAEVVSVNNTYCIDTGCVFGGKLTAMRYPEKELVSVEAYEQYSEPLRPLESDGSENIGDMLTIGDFQGRMHISTELIPSISIDEFNVNSALEIMSRYSADPHWLIYLPPTMSPCETSSIDGWLEHPIEAFEYYHKNGIKNVVCEKKHMGSRSVIVLCHSPETAQKRFGINDGSAGIIYTRTGRRFFDNPETEKALLARLDNVLTENNFWEDFATDWVCLDTELMPWSEKAQGLIKTQYAPVGNAGRTSLSHAVNLLEKACERENISREVSALTSGQNTDLSAVLEKYRFKKEAVDRYIAAYREYCWTVKSIDDFWIAPFHILAVEGKVFDKEKHIWHMETIKKYICTDSIFMATPYICVDTENEENIHTAVEWWSELTSSGGEGMVVKPEYYTAISGNKLLQPAVKCRGREYLRIIYGAEYLEPSNLKRLKKRSLSRKRTLALKEFSLGMESLKRFVRNEPLYKVHECAFGVLAFESEPVDPRL